MRGSVVRRGDGYTVVVELDRDPITNKRRQKWHSGYRTKRDAERALSELVGLTAYRQLPGADQADAQRLHSRMAGGNQADNPTVNALQL